MILADFEAAKVTGLDARTIHAVLNPDMTCQLGRYEYETIDRPAIKNGPIAQFDGYKGRVKFFRLLAFGKNWEAAIRMYANRMTNR